MKYFFTEDRIVCVEGQGAAQFLHGQFSNAIKDLGSGFGNYNLFLSIKGKVRSDLYILHLDDKFFLIIPQQFLAQIFEYLKKLEPLSQSTVTDVSDKFRVLHVLDQSSFLPKLELNQLQKSDINQKSVFLFRSDRLGKQGIDVIVSTDDLDSVTQFLTSNKLQEADDQSIELIRIKNAVAKVGVDATEDNLPQEACLDRALNFEKGCYLGQEVVARLKYRGHLNKILVPLISEARGISAGDEILFNGESCGIVTSVAYDEQAKQSFLLGYVPAKHNASGTEFEVTAAKIKIV